MMTLALFSALGLPTESQAELQAIDARRAELKKLLGDDFDSFGHRPVIG